MDKLQNEYLIVRTKYGGTFFGKFDSAVGNSMILINAFQVDSKGVWSSLLDVAENGPGLHISARVPVLIVYGIILSTCVKLETWKDYIATKDERNG